MLAPCERFGKDGVGRDGCRRAALYLRTGIGLIPAKLVKFQRKMVDQMPDQQAVAGGDILTNYTHDGQEMLLFIPRHAICSLEFAIADAESEAVADAFCE